MSSRAGLILGRASSSVLGLSSRIHESLLTQPAADSSTAGAVARDIRACTSIFYPYVYAKTRPGGGAAALGDNETLYGQDMSLALFNELFTGLDVQLITALAL